MVYRVQSTCRVTHVSAPITLNSPATCFSSRTSFVAKNCSNRSLYKNQLSTELSKDPILPINAAIYLINPRRQTVVLLVYTLTPLTTRFSMINTLLSLYQDDARRHYFSMQYKVSK